MRFRKIGWLHLTQHGAVTIREMRTFEGRRR